MSNINKDSSLADVLSAGNQMLREAAAVRESNPQELEKELCKIAQKKDYLGIVEYLNSYRSDSPEAQEKLEELQSTFPAGSLS